ncbi:hypothetical protein V8C86DRAFT_1423065 [Haematococcus lacustris]
MPMRLSMHPGSGPRPPPGPPPTARPPPPSWSGPCPPPPPTCQQPWQGPPTWQQGPRPPWPHMPSSWQPLQGSGPPAGSGPGPASQSWPAAGPCQDQWGAEGAVAGGYDAAPKVPRTSEITRFNAGGGADIAGSGGRGRGRGGAGGGGGGKGRGAGEQGQGQGRGHGHGGAHGGRGGGRGAGGSIAAYYKPSFSHDPWTGLLAPGLRRAGPALTQARKQVPSALPPLPSPVDRGLEIANDSAAAAGTPAGGDLAAEAVSSAEGAVMVSKCDAATPGQAEASTTESQQPADISHTAHPPVGQEGGAGKLSLAEQLEEGLRAVEGGLGGDREEAGGKLDQEASVDRPWH